MDWTLFCVVIGAGLLLLIAEVVCAWNDDFLTQKQIHRKYGFTEASSFWAHRGWVSVFTTLPVAAFVTAKYIPNFLELRAVLLLMAVAATSLVIKGLLEMSSQMGGGNLGESDYTHLRHGLKPQPYSTYTRITSAWYIHELYKVGVIWAFCLGIMKAVKSSTLEESDFSLIGYVLIAYIVLYVAGNKKLFS